MKEEIRFQLCGRVTQVKPVKGVNGRVFTRVHLQCAGVGREVASVAAVEFHGETEQQELKQVRVNDQVLVMGRMSGRMGEKCVFHTMYGDVLAMAPAGASRAEHDGSFFGSLA